MKHEGDMILDCVHMMGESFGKAKDIIIGTHSQEAKLAEQIIASQDGFINESLKRLSGDNLSPEDKAIYWEHIDKAQSMQERVLASQVASGKETRNAFFGILAAFGLLYAGAKNPELGKSIVQSLPVLGRKVLSA